MEEVPLKLLGQDTADHFHSTANSQTARTTKPATVPEKLTWSFHLSANRKPAGCAQHKGRYPARTQGRNGEVPPPIFHAGKAHDMPCLVLQRCSYVRIRAGGLPVEHRNDKQASLPVQICRRIKVKHWNSLNEQTIQFLALICKKQSFSIFIPHATGPFFTYASRSIQNVGSILSARFFKILLLGTATESKLLKIFLNSFCADISGPGRDTTYKLIKPTF